MGSVTLRSHGAARTVTGSRHLLTTDQMRVLLDCGMFQGRRAEADAANRGLDIETDSVVLSHAHIDHSGSLPSLVKNGYRGKIHATSATFDLCRAMLMDSARIQEADARYLNKRLEKGEERIEPIYDQDDVKRTLEHFVTHPYRKSFDVGPGTIATFHDAGHILGSAGVLVEPSRGPTIYFTGDLGRRMYPILKDPEPLPDVDVVLSECTYGNREHEPVDLAEEKLRAIVQRAIDRKGKVFIPAFSVGRTQNLVYAFARLRERNAIPPIPVVVDSPLAMRATEVFAQHPECYDEEIRDFLSDGGMPFYPRWLHYTKDRQESIALNHAEGPLIIIAASGMCEGGRIAHHLKHGLSDGNNTVLFVGWQAPYTLGRRIVEKQREVRVFGRPVRVRAEIESLRAYSAHAGRSGLIEFLAPAAERKSSIYLVHGDEETALEFAETLCLEGHASVTVPEPFEDYELTTRP